MGISSLLRLATILALGLMTAPALAQAVTVAEPGTPEYAAGDAILYYVNGRSLDDVGGPAFNPFEIEGDGLLFSAGAFFVVTEFDGTGLHEGEFSIYPMYQMPRLVGSPSADTPPVIPFAFLQKGTCHAGYVGGYPVPDTIYAVDMTGQVCHADSVEQLVADAYAALGNSSAGSDDTPAAEDVIDTPVSVSTPGFDPAFPSDLDLANAVYYAYNVAYNDALADPDYAFWDGSNLSALRDKIITELDARGLVGIAVDSEPVADAAATKTCAAPRTTELRLAFTPSRTGIALAAASASRYYVYEYDSAISPDIRITDARDCATSGLGRSPSRSH